MPTKPIDKVMAACSTLGLPVIQKGGWSRCPHPCSPEGDKRLSFAFLEQPDGIVIVKSHKGYSDLESIQKLGLEWRDLYPEKVTTYAYNDRKGNRVGAVKRTASKEFFQYHYDGDKCESGLGGRVLPMYLAPQVESWISQGLPVFVVEGEKDALSLASRGFPATSKSGGAKSQWQPENVALFDGADVVVVADKDEAGYEAARLACLALFPVARSVKVVEARHGKDATDHLEAGLAPSEFVPRDDLLPPPTTDDGRVVTCTDVSEIGETSAPVGVPTGWSWIDTRNESGGLPKGQMTVLCARKKVGKTAAMAQWACNILEAGHRVLFVTLTDLTKDQIFRRMVRQQTGWANSPDSLEMAKDWQDKVQSFRTFWELKLADAKDLGGRNIEALVPGIEALNRRYRFDVVVVDYAQKITSTEQKDRVRALEKASSELSYMAANRGFALVVGSQTNEDGGTRYSQEFEDDCGLMVDILAPDGRESPTREFKVPYSRFGPSGYEFQGRWDVSRLRFEVKP